MLNSLQICRALAALCVAAFHLSIMMGEVRFGGHNVFAEYTNQGNRGVDFFFVLSGFIIAFAHQKDLGVKSLLGTYLLKRFIRIYPIYWFYTLVFSLALLLNLGTNARIPNNLIDWMTVITLLRFSDTAPPFHVAWTLFHEVEFYLLFSILIVNLRFGVVALVSCALLSLYLYQFPNEGNRNWFNVYTSAYNLFFMFGIASYYVYKTKGNGYLELFLTTILFVLFSFTLNVNSSLFSVMIAANMGLLLSGLAKLERANIFKTSSMFVLLGNATFSIYLLHENIESLILKIFMKLGAFNYIDDRVIYIVVLIGTMSLGSIAYILFEKPLLKMTRNYLLKA